jgi:hypothetical protein
MKRALLLLIFAPLLRAGVPIECGEWPEKPPWQWTLDERLDRRFDGPCLAARRARAADDARTDGSCRGSGVSEFVFGTDTPELFLPHELFTSIINMASSGEAQEHFRETFMERAKENGIELPADFWKTLREAAAEYVAIEEKHTAMVSQFGKATPAEQRAISVAISEAQNANCAARQRALEGARAVFGGDLFDRILYTVVAHGLCMSGDGDAGTAAWIAGGCR